MPDLVFEVKQAAPVAYAAAPTLAFTLRVTNLAGGERIHSVALRCQLQLEVTRRTYTEVERKAMRDLFGEPSRWSQTLRPVLWTHVNATIPAFEQQVQMELQTPCTFDFNVAATKYFHGLTEGEVPVQFLFSGTVYYEGADGRLAVAPIAWDNEARFRLPVGVWREMMDSYYPNTAWLCLRRDAFESLYRYKVEHGIATWETTIEELLEESRKATVQ